MIASPRTRHLGRSLAATTVVLVGALVLGGCNSDDSAKPSSSPNASSGAQASAASTVESLVAAGISQAESGDSAAARTTFENVLTIDPGNKFAYYNLGILDSQDGATDAAIANYDKALETDPEYTPAMYNKAILLESSDADQALSIYESIVAIDPNASTSYLRLSFLQDTKGETEKATTAREKALALDPSLASVPSPTPGAAGTGE